MSRTKDDEALDRDLLEVLLKEREDKLTREQFEAFSSMVEQKWPLSEKQSEWVRAVARKLGVFSPPAENLFSSMTPAERAKHLKMVQTKLPWESGQMTRPAKPPGKE